MSQVSFVHWLILACAVTFMHLPRKIWCHMIYYRVALRLNDSSPWQWQSTTLATLETMFRFLRIYGDLGLSNDRIRVFFASSRRGLDEMLTRENRGAISNSITLEQLVTKCWNISLAEMRRLEAELSIQEHEGLESTTVLGKQQMNGKLMPLQEMIQDGAEWGVGGDHDVPYYFTLPLFMPEALTWARLLAKAHRREFEF